MAKETENKDLDYNLVLKALHVLFEKSYLGYIILAKSNQKVAGSLMVTYELDVLRN